MSRFLKLNKCFIDPHTRRALEPYTQWEESFEISESFRKPERGEVIDEAMNFLTGIMHEIKGLAWTIVEYMADPPTSTKITLDCITVPDNRMGPDPLKVTEVVKELGLDRYLKRGDIIFPNRDHQDGNYTLVIWKGDKGATELYDWNPNDGNTDYSVPLDILTNDLGSSKFFEPCLTSSRMPYGWFQVRKEYHLTTRPFKASNFYRSYIPIEFRESKDGPVEWLLLIEFWKEHLDDDLVWDWVNQHILSGKPFHHYWFQENEFYRHLFNQVPLHRILKVSSWPDIDREQDEIDTRDFGM